MADMPLLWVKCPAEYSITNVDLWFIMQLRDRRIVNYIIINLGALKIINSTIVRFLSFHSDIERKREMEGRLKRIKK